MSIDPDLKFKIMDLAFRSSTYKEDSAFGLYDRMLAKIEGAPARKPKAEETPPDNPKGPGKTAGKTASKAADKSPD